VKNCDKLMEVVGPKWRNFQGQINFCRDFNGD